MHVCLVMHGVHTVFTAAEFQGVSLGAVAGFVTMHTLIALHTPAHIDFFTRRRVRADVVLAMPFAVNRKQGRSTTRSSG